MSFSYPLQLATWNINSVRARLDNVRTWLDANPVDVLALQEIKCETHAFPAAFFTEIGYPHHRVLGQKSYNGVALVSRHPLDDPQWGLPDDAPDASARYVEATLRSTVTGDSIRVASVYAPNGNPVDSSKFDDKITWHARLRAHARKLFDLKTPVALMGDYNIIPEPRDVYDPKAWEGDALYHPASRTAFRNLMNDGWVDSYRMHHPDEARAFTFWDYQAGAWLGDKGLRIDHILLSPEAADGCTACTIDKTPRGCDKPSDHTVVFVAFGVADWV